MYAERGNPVTSSFRSRKPVRSRANAARHRPLPSRALRFPTSRRNGKETSSRQAAPTSCRAAAYSLPAWRAAAFSSRSSDLARRELENSALLPVSGNPTAPPAPPGDLVSQEAFNEKGRGLGRRPGDWSSRSRKDFGLRRRQPRHHHRGMPVAVLEDVTPIVSSLQGIRALQPDAISFAWVAYLPMRSAKFRTAVDIGRVAIW